MIGWTHQRIAAPAGEAVRINPLVFDSSLAYRMFDGQIAEIEAAGRAVVRVELGNRPFDHKTVDQLLARPELGELYAGTFIAPERNLVVDLRDCSFIDPYAATVVHALLTEVSRRGTRVWVCLPDQGHVRAYCGVIGLTEQLREHVTLVGETSRQRPSDASEVLVPLQVFSGQSEVEELIATSTERLDALLDRLEWPKAVVSSAVSAIKEVTMNVLEHAGATGCFTLQAYKLNTSDPYIIVALSDAGLGIRATLERKYDDLPSQDPDVLAALFDRQLTSREGYVKGHGMRTLRDAVREVKGTLHLRSGAGAYYASSRKTGWSPRAHIPGTHLRLALNGPSGN